MSNIVKYGTYEVEAADKEAEDLERGSTEFLKFKVGRTVMRLLPPPLGKKSPFRVVWTHYVNLPGAADPISFACPRQEGKKPCPICSRADQLKGTGNPADYDRAKELFAKRRIYANVINREEPEKGPVVAGFGKTIHEALVALRRDPDAGGDFCHPDSGYDIIIERKGTGKNDTEYKVFPARKSTPLGNMDWIEVQHDLERYAQILTPEEIRAKLSGEKDGGQPQQQARDIGGGKASATPRRTVESDAVQGEVVEGEPPF